MNYINQDLSQVSCIESGSEKRRESSYDFPYNLTKDQREHIDMQQLEDVVRMAQPDGVAFRDVSVAFDDYTGKLAVYIVSSARIDDDDFRKKLMHDMNVCVENDLKDLNPEQDFADALSSIPASEKGMER